MIITATTTRAAAAASFIGSLIQQVHQSSSYAIDQRCYKMQSTTCTAFTDKCTQEIAESLAFD